MQFSRVKVTSLPRKFSFVVLCLAMSLLPLVGCSKPKEKEAQEKKKVVHDLNIQTPADSASGGNASAASGPGNSGEVKGTGETKVEDEIESLPFESGGASKPEPVEEELPVLGGGN